MRSRVPSRSGSATVAALLVGFADAGAQSISDGTTTVRLDPIGVMVAPPAAGLVSTFGPRALFVPGTVEWFGVTFDALGAEVSAVGAGAVADYANRLPVSSGSSLFAPDRALTLGSVTAGIGVALEIEHRFSFCPFTGALIITATLRNTGRAPLRDVVYTREWRRDSIDGATFPPTLAERLAPIPADVMRFAWELHELSPGASQGRSLVLMPTQRSSGSKLGPASDDLPLRLWTNATFPGGLDFGNTNGISFGDYDHDGWIDVVNSSGKKIWRNLAGVDWVEQVDLSPWLNDFFVPYGCAVADYDNDQRPDIANEPRGDCVHVLHSLGNDDFEDVALDPAIVDDPMCTAMCETNSVADVDGDGNLDWFFPIYGINGGSIGNRFLYNLGPDANGVYAFHEMVTEAGLENPPIGQLPEGAGFADFDFDGDLDLYACVAIYRNVSSAGTPSFELLDPTASGMSFGLDAEEGAGLFDYDMDGDIDLCLFHVNSSVGLRMYENRGDGNFKVQSRGLFDGAFIGLPLGLSFEDWDNDGDVDVSSSEIFRRNQFIESDGGRHFTIATHSIDPTHISEATPAWGDFDRDGDVDAAIGNWASTGHLYDNTTYDATTAPELKRHLRVKPVRDSDLFDDGLETEFGAQVTIVPLDHPTDVNRRTKVVSTSGGYLNQNEYTLHFALPTDPDPDPNQDVHFRVIVDFKGNAAQMTVRVDRHVNPVLGDLDLAQLQEREIVIYRSGRVRIDGCDFIPGASLEPLTTVNGGLVMAGLTTAIPAPIAAPAGDWFIGMEIDTRGATSAQRIEELVVDGKLASGVDCGGLLGNTFVWDVTDPLNPMLAAGGMRNFAIRPRNDRNYYALDATLEPGRLYRLAVRVQALRATTITGPLLDGPFLTTGGLSFQDASPCDGAAISAASVDPTRLYCTVRFRSEPTGAFADLGHALTGTQGTPRLTMGGDLRPLSLVTADVDGALANAPIWLVIGLTPTCLPFAGGVLVPAPDVVLSGASTDANGAMSYSECLGDDLPGGESFFLQALVLDPGAARGFSMTNAVSATTPR